MNKRKKLFIIITMCMFILTGCSSVTIEVNPDIRLELSVNLNGSADLDMEMYLDKISFDIFNRLGSTVEEISALLEERGFDTEIVESEDRVGIRAWRRFESGDNIAIAENNIDSIEDIDVENILTVKDYAVVSDYIVDQKFNIKNIVVEAGEFEDTELIESILEQSNIEFILNLPIRPAESNADRVSENGRQMVWNIDPIEENHIQLRVAVPNIESILYLLGINLIALIILIPIYRKIIIIIQDKRKGD